MTLSNLFSSLFIILGTGFFIAGTIGLLRLPDVYSRLHALTKADNLGLGLICIGVAIHHGSLAIAIKLIIIWLLVMFSGAGVSHLIARKAYDKGVKPWTRV